MLAKLPKTSDSREDKSIQFKVGPHFEHVHHRKNISNIGLLEKYQDSNSRACFKENSSLHISMAKAGLQFLNDLFYQKISI